MAYTGTHDNHTAVGWFRSLKKGSVERERALAYVGGEAGEVHWSLIRAVMTSVANTAVFPVQDLLGLGDDCADERARRGPGELAVAVGRGGVVRGVGR